jgi:predicted MFS family arabinose efflux permease
LNGLPVTMTRMLTALCVLIFSSTLFVRCVDPVIPLIASDLAVEPETAALLTTAFALPFAIVQPALGIAADMFGKIRLMAICALVLIVTAVLGALAPNFAVLLSSRVIAGIAAGGVFPASVAVVGDLVPFNKRQIAISRVLAAAMAGNLIGATAAGAIGDLMGWRGVFVALALMGIVGAIWAAIGFRGFVMPQANSFDLSSIVPSYRAIFTNPLAKVCYGTIFIEGIVLFGLFPYVAFLLFESGETRTSIAGIVIGGFGVGGFAYTLCIAALLVWFGERRLMRGGGFVTGVSLIAISLQFAWPVDFIAFIAIGFGFYMLHGVIQVYSSELAPAARGSAMSLHSFFFFLGQGFGPILYGMGFTSFGTRPTLAIGALAFAILGMICAQKLRRPASSSMAP